MDTASVEEKFRHAVEIIRCLPKQGSIQPSNEMKLKFYSYFKQATEGPCDLPKPNFWDVINRAKWDAWNSLGEMSKEDAMQKYVDEFVQILKSTPYDERAKDYVHLMGPFAYLAPKELQEQHMKKNGNIPNKSHNSEAPENESAEIVSNNCHGIKSFKGSNQDFSSGSSEESHIINGINQNGATESDSEEFSDTYDQVNGGQSENEALSVVHQGSTDTIPDTGYYLAHTSKGPSVIDARGGGDQRVVARSSSSPLPSGMGNRGGGSRGHRRNRATDFPSHNPNSYSSNGGSGGRRNNDNHTLEPSSEVSEQLAFAVIRLQHTMDQVVSRLDSLETLLQERNHSSCVSTVKSSFSSVFGIPPRTALVMLVWPFIAYWLLHVIQKRRRNPENMFGEIILSDISRCLRKYGWAWDLETVIITSES